MSNGMNIGRIANIVIDPIGYASRLGIKPSGLPGNESIWIEAADPSLRSWGTVPASLGAYGLGAMAMMTPSQEEEAATVAQQMAARQQAQQQMATITPYEAQLLRQQMMFNEQSKRERAAIREAVLQREARQQQLMNPSVY